MKVNSIQANNMISAYKNQRQYVKQDVMNKSVKDKVIISERAKYLSKINAEAENIDIDKINEIKNKIKSGTYNIDSKDLAKKIVESIKGE